MSDSRKRSGRSRNKDKEIQDNLVVSGETNNTVSQSNAGAVADSAASGFAQPKGV